MVGYPLSFHPYINLLIIFKVYIIKIVKNFLHFDKFIEKFRSPRNFLRILFKSYYPIIALNDLILNITFHVVIIFVI